MKRFLPLFFLTGLLFGQDGLILKSGESYKGTFIRRVGRSSVVFQVEGENDSTKFPINDVAIIKTSDGELTYPFRTSKQKFVRKAFIGCAGTCLFTSLFIIWIFSDMPV